MKGLKCGLTTILMLNKIINAKTIQTQANGCYLQENICAAMRNVSRNVSNEFRKTKT
jgi:hypothetical protein